MRPAFALIALTLACLTPAQAQPRVDFAGKTITIVSSFGAGGGYTIYAELIARHLGARLPGRPTVIVKTMPGAGGLNGTQHLYNVAARDGTVLGVVPQTVAIAQALGEQGLRYDARAFNRPRQLERRGRAGLAHRRGEDDRGCAHQGDHRRRHRAGVVVGGVPAHPQ